MRPGAPCSPTGVWQTLQSPLVCTPTIAREPALVTTLAVYGEGMPAATLP